MDNIEIIYDELKQNQIQIDQHTLAFHINTILDQNNFKIYILKYVFRALNNLQRNTYYKLWPYYRVFSLCIYAK